MTISRLYQRAHALRMEDKKMHGEEAPAEFYLGAAIGERITDLDTGVVVCPRGLQIRLVVTTLRYLAHKPEALRKALLQHLSWPEDWQLVWRSLLRTYGERPRLLLAIADGMEA